MTTFLLSLALAAALAFPPLPKGWKPIQVEPVNCGSFPIFVIHIDQNSDGEQDRTDFYLQDERLFAVAVWHVKTHAFFGVYVLQSNGSIRFFKDIKDIGGAPCEIAKQLLDKRQIF